jgi:hypothetical protein
VALSQLTPFTKWLAATPMSVGIGEVHWITPAVQSVHILTVAVVMAAILMMDLRLLGAFGRSGDGVAAFSRRYLPWVWWALIVLFATGATLIIGEPRRSLQNPTFLLKMALLLIAAALTLVTQKPFGGDAGFWEGRKGWARALAVASLIAWVAIVLCGRWIAYTQE